MIKEHGNPYIPVVFITSALAILGIFGLNSNQNVETVFVTIAIPLSIILGGWIIALTKGKDRDTKA